MKNIRIFGIRTTFKELAFIVLLNITAFFSALCVFEWIFKRNEQIADIHSNALLKFYHVDHKGHRSCTFVIPME